MASQQVSNDSSSSECVHQVLDPKHLEVVEPLGSVVHASIVSSINDRIGQSLIVWTSLGSSTVCRKAFSCLPSSSFGHLNVLQEGIQLPTLVVIGDQSLGKSSVLESLTGISLPRGEGICTRVPLIMKLQNHSETKVYLEYNEKAVPTDEDHVAEAIIHATNAIAGHGKGISNIPLTLILKKNGVPDLTMVDLPGITSDIIMEYIRPEESIIVNVLSATADFTTCESIRMSRKVDKTGERTLAVVTKVDRAPEGLLEKVTTNDMNVGFGYVCVKNCIANESCEEALCEEARVFETHAVLSKMDKCMVSIPLLAHKLVQIQANIISKSFMDIMKKINDKLAIDVAALNELPQHSGSVGEALATFMRICSLATESLKKIFLKVGFDECTEDFEMQCAAKWSELLKLELKQYSAQLCSEYLMDELVFLLEAQKSRLVLSAKEIQLSNLRPCAVYLDVLQKRVSDISATTREFVGKLWNYIEGVVIKVLMHHAGTYPELQYFIERAVQNLIARRKDELVDWVGETIGTDRLTDSTSNPEYVATYSRLVVHKKASLEVLPIS